MVRMNDGRKILITGASGRLGSTLRQAYAARHLVLSPTRQELDLSRPEKLAEILRPMDFDLCIHCAAITSPDVCEREPELAERVNAQSPAVIASECQRRGARLIHLSTDYVFGGEGDTPLSESDATAPVSTYGRTKLTAESAVLQACPSALVARVSWLFGGAQACFPEQMLAQARAGREVEAIGDKWSVPTCMDDIAVWLELLWQQEPAVHGLLHLCNSGLATWQTFAQAALDIAYKKGLLEQPATVKGNRLEAFTGFLAKRPRYTPMANQKLVSLLGESPRSWQDALSAHLGRSALRL